MTAAVTATVLRAVHSLTRLDVLQVSNDPRLYRVMLVERTCGDLDARHKVHLRSIDDISAVMLVRGGREMVLAVTRSGAAAVLAEQAAR